MRGLLLQSGVAQSWAAVTANYDVSAFNWDQSSNQDLQLRLELGIESAGSLALAAFECSSYEDDIDDDGLVMLPSDKMGKYNEQLPPSESYESTEQTAIYDDGFSSSSCLFSPNVLTSAPVEMQALPLLDDSTVSERRDNSNLLLHDTYPEDHDMTLDPSYDGHINPLLLQPSNLMRRTNL